MLCAKKLLKLIHFFSCFSVPPLAVTITGDRKRAFSAGKESTLECRCQGSRPIPVFRWFIDNRELEVASASTSDSEADNNGQGEWTSSVIKFVAKPEDNGKYIVCKATNEYFPDLVKEDGYIINVHCKFDNKLTRSKRNFQFSTGKTVRNHDSLHANRSCLLARSFRIEENPFDFL